MFSADRKLKAPFCVRLATSCPVEGRMGIGLGPVAGFARDKQQREGQTPHHEILPAGRPLRSVLPSIPIRPPNPHQGANTASHPAVWDRASSSDSLFVTAKRRDVAGHQERHTLHPRDIRVIQRLTDHGEFDSPWLRPRPSASATAIAAASPAGAISSLMSGRNSYYQRNTRYALLENTDKIKVSAEAIPKQRARRMALRGL